MNPISYIIATCVLLILLFIYCNVYYGNVTSTIDNEKYSVLKYYNDSDKAADLIARVNARVFKFLRYLKLKYRVNISDDGSINTLRKEVGDSPGLHMPVKNPQTTSIVGRVLRNYNPEVIIENDPRLSTETSYTINKGNKLIVCLRNKVNYKLHDEEIVFFVILHEIAHMGNIGWAHDVDFWIVFKFLLYEAVGCGIYHPVDYSKANIVYCGLNVNYNPLYDNSLVNIWETHAIQVQ